LAITRTPSAQAAVDISAGVEFETTPLWLSALVSSTPVALWFGSYKPLSEDYPSQL
jgi:hypothetical protein